MDLALSPVLSLGEAEALAREAARGAGLPWGLAEEAGRAARALCAADLPGLDALALRLLVGGPCPIRAGCRASDAGEVPKVLDVAVPLLLLPFLAPLTAIAEWGNGVLRSGPEGIAAEGALLTPRARLRLTVREAPGRVACVERAHPSSRAWRRLSTLAARTRAPASEASRRGAG